MMAKYYTRIKLERMAELLDLAPKVSCSHNTVKTNFKSKVGSER